MACALLRAHAVSIRAPREGGDLAKCTGLAIQPMFQSAPPVKGATPLSRMPILDSAFQSAPPVKGATSAERSR